MDIQNKTVLVLGGWGLVGSAICRNLMEERPKRIIVTSLLEREAKEAVDLLRKEFPNAGKDFFVPWWGNIFHRYAFKDRAKDELLRDPKTRAAMIDDLLDEVTSNLLKRSSIYRLLAAHKPDIIIDCINSATAIAYQDLFSVARSVRSAIRKGKRKSSSQLIEATERLLAVQYVPQLIRHVQILYRSMQIVKTNIYVKIGTSGTGGMGLNIPYTHSEERPSSVLLSKSSVAGAHTLLLFLMGRTPNGPITKEIKPTAAIAWKKIGFGEIRKRGKAIELVDCPPSQGVRLHSKLQLKLDKPIWKSTNRTLRAVFIDTGENGTFSRAEFEAISTPGQMEFVTPEEIADSVIFEIKGGNTGHDIINALDNASLAPTYRAGFMFENALKQLKMLEEDTNSKSIAFEMLGPPRLSKLLYEAHLLQLTYGSVRQALEASPKDMSQNLSFLLETNSELRSQIISIGIPILMPDGNTLLRGNEIKIPPYRGDNELKITTASLNAWAHDGWVDLRLKNMERWQQRFRAIVEENRAISPSDTSSRFFRSKIYWNNFSEIDPGKIVGWIFTVEEKGRRMKA
ncbi:MAG: short-chain dehydrogenase [Ignavibacteriales bacterium]|nr:short-chain dehydrogenase [Ignavibacteriales bacterium]